MCVCVCDLRKFTSNSSQLCDKVEREDSSDANSSPPVLSNTDESGETYMRATLGGSQTLHSGQQKIFEVEWNVNTDPFVVSFDEIARLVTNLKPTK